MTARRKRKPSPVPTTALHDPTSIADLGPAARARESSVHAIEGKRISTIRGEPVYVRRYAADCRIDALSHSAQISDRQWAAGIKFRHYYRISELPRSTTGAYGERLPGARDPDNDQATRIAAAQKIAQAADVLGSGLYPVVLAVAGMDESAGRVLRILQIALTILADLWGIDKEFSR